MAVSAPVALPPVGSEAAGSVFKPMASTEAAIVAVSKYRTGVTPRSLSVSAQRPRGLGTSTIEFHSRSDTYLAFLIRTLRISADGAARQAPLRAAGVAAPWLTGAMSAATAAVVRQTPSPRASPASSCAPTARGVGRGAAKRPDADWTGNTSILAAAPPPEEMEGGAGRPGSRPLASDLIARGTKGALLGRLRRPPGAWIGLSTSLAGSRSLDFAAPGLTSLDSAPRELGAGVRPLTPNVAASTRRSR